MLAKLLLLTILWSVNSLPINDQLTCDYSSCPKTEPNKLNIHIVAHTHDDVGWLKTVDQYYYGKQRVTRGLPNMIGVQYIYDSVVDALNGNNDRRFIFVETAFFWKWWQEQSESTRAVVKKMVNTGKIELIGGGWSMNDEACTHYNSIIDQMTWGFRRLKDVFGDCGIPKIAWQIDPFGHSREQASLFAQMNYDGLLFPRIDVQEMSTRERNKSLEMMWSGSDELGQASSIFTSVMARRTWEGLYGPPPGFCFDLVLCRDDPIIDNKEAVDYNLDKRLDAFIKWTRAYAQKYTSNNIMVTFGDDFTYQYANGWFKNIDKLIKHINNRTDLNWNLFYSTPSCYVKSIQQTRRPLVTKTDDFFPYASDLHAFWTGYFTSRPSSKYFERVGNNVLQVCKQLDSLARLNNTDQRVTLLREAMGVFQHHDAITGTERQDVTEDYHYLLTKGISACESVISQALSRLMIKNNLPGPDQIFCRLLNVSECAITESKSQIAVTVFNPIGRNISHYVRVPVIKNSMVYGPDGKEVASELISIPDYVQKIPGRKSRTTKELLFKADVPAVGFSTYFIKSVDNKINGIQEDMNSAFDGYFIKNSEKIKIKDDLTKYEMENNIENDHRNSIEEFEEKINISGKNFVIFFDPKTGMTDSIQLKDAEQSKISLKQTFKYYKSKTGDNRKPENQASGAYVFRPDGQSPVDVSGPTFTITRGQAVTEVRQIWNSWISQTVRVYYDSDFVEFDWVVGPIPVNDKIGKEVITRFDTDLASNATFFTDANGRQMVERIRNFRKSFKLMVTEPVSGNYYPVNSRIALVDQNKRLQMTILSDRSQGGASIKNGSAELMIHRRCLVDDAFGVDEALNETGIDGRGLVVRGRHLLVVSSLESAARLHRDLAQRLFLQPAVSFAEYQDVNSYLNNFTTSFTGLTNQLPANIHLLTLERWSEGRYLIRLEHFYQTGEDPVLSKPTVVSLAQLFKPFVVVKIEETSLGGNQKAGDRKRLEFKTIDELPEMPVVPVSEANFTVTFSPMQIRTFLVEVK